jgi:hypothetical protein
MVVKLRPKTCTFRWKEGATNVGGKLTGGVDHSISVPCRVEEMVNEFIEVDGTQVVVKFKIFVNLFETADIDRTTLTVSFDNVVKHKVIRILPRQSYMSVLI